MKVKGLSVAKDETDRDYDDVMSLRPEKGRLTITRATRAVKRPKGDIFAWTMMGGK